MQRRYVPLCGSPFAQLKVDKRQRHEQAELAKWGWHLSAECDMSLDLGAVL